MRDQLACLRRSPTSHRIPAWLGLKTLYMNRTVIYLVSATRNIPTISLKVLRSPQFINTCIDEAQRMTSHLIDDSDKGCPERCAGTGNTDLCPLPIDIRDHCRERIGISR